MGHAVQQQEPTFEEQRYVHRYKRVPLLIELRLRTLNYTYNCVSMDPLSAVGSIIAIIQLVGTVISYLDGVKDASEERTQLLVEISGVGGLLTTLRDLAVASEKEGTALASVKSLDVPLGPLEQFRLALERIAVVLAPSRGVKKFGRSLAWPFKKDEVLELLGVIERQKSLFILALQSDNLRLSQAIHADVAGLNNGLKHLQLGRVVDHRDRALQWLRPPRVSTLHDEAKSKREPTTGNWFIQGDQFKAWKLGQERLLWLHGSPGCGKTILCSTIIEHMQQSSRLHPNCALGYHYFDWNNSENQLVSTMLRSIIAQLASNAFALPGAIQTLYNQERGNPQAPSVPALLETLTSVVKEVQMHLYIVMDALDECSERELVVETIADILDLNKDKLQILVASRREQDIEFGLQPLGGCIVPIQSNIVDEDIAIHVHNRLLQDRQLKKWPDPIKEQIKSTLVKFSQGMFRWIVCQLDALKRCLKISVLKKVLTQLPKTLGESYDRILLAIPEDYTQEAYFALQFLAFSERPLHITEVAEAAVMDPALGSFDPEDRLSDPQDILQICSSLVTVLDNTHALDELRLAHFSVKEYFLGEGIRKGPASAFAMREADAHAHIAHVCLFLLHQFGRPGSLSEQSFEEFSLLRYAAQFWHHHIRKVGIEHSKSKNLGCLTSSILNPKTGESFVNWLRIYNPDYMGQPGKLKARLESLPPPLYLASHLNLLEPTQKILGAGADVDSRGGENGTALAAASFSGHERIVKLLIDANADVNAQAGHFKSALQGASYNGHDRVAALLIDRGADVNVEGRFGSPLQAAARFGHTNLISMLLENGADINRQGSRFHTPLQEAARWGQDKTVAFLLDKGADIDARAKDSSTALQLASSNDHAAVVRILVKRGAAVNAPAGDFGTALQEACRWGNEKSAAILLEHKADPNLQIGNYGTALQAASRWGHSKIVKLLLDRGANIEARSARLGTGLDAAQHWKQHEVVKLLLDRGAVDLPLKENLQAATDWADKNIFPALFHER